MKDSAIEKMAEGISTIGSKESCVLLVDTSGSMKTSISGKISSDIFDPPARDSKIGAMTSALKKMLNERIRSDSDDQLSIITFGGYSWEGIRTLFDLKKVSSFELDTIENMYASGGTPMLQGATRAIENLDAAEGMCRLVIFSDGNPESDSKEKIKNLIKNAAEEYGIVVDTVAVGSKGDFEYDEDFMMNLAALGKGKFYKVNSKGELEELLITMERERRILMGHGTLLLGMGSPLR